MIRYTLPNPEYSNNSAPSGAGNTVIYASTEKKYLYPRHSTPHVLIANFQNDGTYLLNDRQISVNDKAFYFLNPGDKLEINFRNDLPRQTCMVLFDNHFVTDIMNACQSTTSKLLDGPLEKKKDEFNIPAVPFFYNAAILQVFDLIKSGSVGSFCNIDVLLTDLMVEFSRLRLQTIPAIDRIDAKRKSTREELYKRITMARSYMEDNVLSPLTIDQIAREACLNKFHFLKLFKSHYGITPHQFLLNKKLDEARVLLKSGNFSATEVCRTIGFESLGSFSNLFKKRFGLPPSKFGVVN